MSHPKGIFRPSLCLMAAFLCLCRCGSEEGRSLSSDAREMRLTSDYTEIAVNSSRVPGYWARQYGDGRSLFLYTLDRAFRKGESLVVEGPFGSAWAAVFDDKTRAYESGKMTIIIVVRKMTRFRSGTDGGAKPAEVPGR